MEDGASSADYVGVQPLDLQLFARSAAELLRILEEHAWSAQATGADVSSSLDISRCALDTARKQERADEVAMVKAQKTAEAVQEAAALATEAARCAGDALDATRARVEQLLADARQANALPTQGTQGTQGDKTGKRAVRLAKAGAHAARLLQSAAQCEEENAHLLEEQNGRLSDACALANRLEEETTRLQEVEDDLRVENERLQAQADERLVLEDKCEQLSEQERDSLAAHDVTKEKLQRCLKINELQINLIERAKKNIMEKDMIHQQKVERLLHQKNSVVGAMKEELQRQNPSMVGLRDVVTQFEDETFLARLIESDPELQDKLDANAKEYARSCKTTENEHLRKVGKERGVKDMTEAATMSLSRGASQMLPAPLSPGLSESVGLSAKKRRRRGGDF